MTTISHRIGGCGLPIHAAGVLHINSEHLDWCEREAEVMDRKQTAWELEKYGVTNLLEIADD